jgi:hypothetical protein
MTTPPCLGDDDPFADTVDSYLPGADADPYDDPSTALGMPERFTGEQLGFDSVVSAFSPPFGTDELVSIGAGGHLVLRFDTAVTDDPDNLYGIDLIVFGNTGFIDGGGFVAKGYFGADGGTVEVSVDGLVWHKAQNTVADGPFPTIGYLDTGPYDTAPGVAHTNFTQPVDPGLTLAHFVGLTHEEVVEAYRGSGGGWGIDLALLGLAQINYVRISQPIDADNAAEIDAVADVPPRLPGDVNLDSIVNTVDLLALIIAWGPVAPGDPPADFNRDGVVNTIDLIELLQAWTL